MLTRSRFFIPLLLALVVAQTASPRTSSGEDCNIDNATSTLCLIFRDVTAFGSYSHTNTVSSARTAETGITISRDSTNVGEFGLEVKKPVVADLMELATGEKPGTDGVSELIVKAVYLTATVKYGDTIKLRNSGLRDDITAAETYSIGARYEVDLGTVAKHLSRLAR